MASTTESSSTVLHGRLSHSGCSSSTATHNDLQVLLGDSQIHSGPWPLSQRLHPSSLVLNGRALHGGLSHRGCSRAPKGTGSLLLGSRRSKVPHLLPPWVSQAGVRLPLPSLMSPGPASPTIPSGALVAASQTPTPPSRYIAWPQRAHAGETSIRTSVSSQAPVGLERPTSPSALLPCLSEPNSTASAAIIQTPE